MPTAKSIPSDPPTDTRSRGKKRKTASSSDTTADTTYRAAKSGTGSYFAPFVIDDDDDDEISFASKALTTTKGKRKFSGHPPLGSMQSSSSMQSSNSIQSPSPGHRWKEPIGVYIGKWIQSGLALHAANAVYASVDRFGRVNRRISKEDNTGIVVSGSRYDAKKTACSHADIAYIDKYVGKSKETVDAVIKGILNLQTAPLALEAAPTSSLL